MTTTASSSGQPQSASFIIKREPLRQFFNPVFLSVSLWRLLIAWFYSRNWRSLMASVPAILGIILALAVALAAAGTNASRIKWKYEVALGDAVRSKNTEAESLWRRALMEMDPKNAQYRYEWALRCDEQGLKEQAQQTMVALAARDEGGFAPAHLWLANRALNTPQLNDAALQSAVKHVEAVLEADANSPPAIALAAQAYLRYGQEDKAEPYLTKAVQWYPHLRVPLARILLKRQKMDSARAQLEEATGAIRGQLTRNPDDTESRLALADAYQMLNRPEAAEEVLSQTAGDADPRIDDRLAQVLVAKAARLRTSQLAAAKAQRVEAVLTAYRQSPTSPLVLQELMLLLTDRVPLDKATRDGLEVDFNKRLSEDPQQPLVQVLLGFVLLQGNRERPGLEHLETAAKANPQYAMTLARVLRDRKQDAAAQQWLETAAKQLGEAAAAKQQDLALQLAWADAEMQLQHWDQAKKILRDGHAQSKDPRCLQALAQVLASEHDAVPAGDDQPKQRLALLQESLTLWPESPFALGRLSELTFRSDEIGREARQELSKLRTTNARSQVLQLLGVAASKLGKKDVALQLFTHVACLEVQDPFIQNNLAFALAEQQPPALDRALELVDSALQKSPDQPEFHATRGEILLKQQRWADALKNLQAALEAGLDRADIHQSLAAAYAGLNQSDLAEQHRQKAAALQTGDKPDATEKPVAPE